MMFLLDFLTVLSLAFVADKTALLLHFAMGHPDKDTESVSSKAILAILGNWISDAYHRYERLNPKGINPFSFALCNICLSQWVGLILFAIAYLMLGINGKLFVLYPGLVYYWSTKSY